ncbi:MAG TPA: ABC transporter ATP-binding protein [Stellaceae bacterium]|nr:ABC transporter ATP-binding protein [Stellaceae bacterium]
MTEPVLRTEALSKRFGGLAAVSDVALDLRHGEVHAVIGPNGAGKTTLINLLSGDLAPSSGSILFEGREIAGLAADRIARIGIARSYQRTTVFRDFTAFENCRLAAQARLPSSMRFVRPALSNRGLRDTALRALSLVGLEAAAERRASTLSHGEQRQLEIAMTLATAPKVLLLDEPLAGMGAEESRRMVALIAALAERHAILLVEHDMDAVFSIARRLTVMVNGRVLESGTPAAIRESPAVQEAYLGGAEARP